MRSADTISSRWPSATTASTSSGTGSRPKRAMKRAARSIRSGSSEKLTSGVERRAQRRRGEVGGAAERVDERGVGGVAARSSSAIALIVKSRRPRSASMSSANVTCGLRESSA